MYPNDTTVYTVQVVPTATPTIVTPPSTVVCPNCEDVDTPTPGGPPTDTPVPASTSTPVATSVVNYQVHISNQSTPVVVVNTPVHTAYTNAALVWLITLIFAKLLILALYQISEDNVFKRLEELILTSMFVAVDILIIYPLLQYGEYLIAGGLWFAFWLVIIFLRDMFRWLTNIG